MIDSLCVCVSCSRCGSCLSFWSSCSCSSARVRDGMCIRQRISLMHGPYALARGWCILSRLFCSSDTVCKAALPAPARKPLILLFLCMRAYTQDSYCSQCCCCCCFYFSRVFPKLSICVCVCVNVLFCLVSSKMLWWIIIAGQSAGVWSFPSDSMIFPIFLVECPSFYVAWWWLTHAKCSGGGGSKNQAVRALMCTQKLGASEKCPSHKWFCSLLCSLSARSSRAWQTSTNQILKYVHESNHRFSVAFGQADSHLDCIQPILLMRCVRIAGQADNANMSIHSGFRQPRKIPHETQRKSIFLVLAVTPEIVTWRLP